VKVVARESNGQELDVHDEEQEAAGRCEELDEHNSTDGDVVAQREDNLDVLGFRCQHDAILHTVLCSGMAALASSMGCGSGEFRQH